jgi:hypothetical protein
MARASQSTASRPITRNRLAELHSFAASAALRSRVAAQQIVQDQSRRQSSQPRSQHSS